MTSTIGASFTSVSFLQTLVKPVGRHLALSTSTFITIATVAFLVLGTTPKSLLVFAGAFNGLILPFGLALVLWVANAAGSGGGRCGGPSGTGGHMEMRLGGCGRHLVIVAAEVGFRARKDDTAGDCQGIAAAAAAVLGPAILPSCPYLTGCRPRHLTTSRGCLAHDPAPLLPTPV